MNYEVYENLFYSGNITLMKNPSLAMFCSRTIPIKLYLSALELMKFIASMIRFNNRLEDTQTNPLLAVIEKYCR
ncbi:MAG: hypothetical protein P9M11_07040 [Candidatus Tenebribacter burtonii]|jgi:hypothetical protein|nr:hypothetical protein [Candidatus Tenebribacter burtonii]